MIIALIVLFVVLFVVLPIVAAGALWWLISTAIVGLIIGGLGRLAIPGRQSIGLLATVLLGLVGSIVGGFIGHGIGINGFLTVLLEIGVAAAAVLTYSVATASRGALGGNHRRRLNGPRR
ncbi:MAG TPA: hypothetical protein VE152_07335 [Acidimicrobiales bacterium]|jgi:uncharacterized membrane protein YeaQ/YmgE (transglycosylase-associated protein family)|nr:hypothetical protein [Acidimicrobiales bacterium]